MAARELVDSKEFESRIIEGDRDAMAQYLATALSQDLSNSELDHRYYVVWEADHGNDSMVMRNLAIVAAAAGHFEKTYAFAHDFLNSSFFADAYHAALALKDFGEEDEHKKACEIISELSHRGHIPSQVMERSLKLMGQGVTQKITFLFFRVYKILQAAVLIIKKPDDPRVSS
jgi:hypothetical protein